MGYDPSLIHCNGESEKFMCTICFEIAEIPKKCSNCNKIFCGKCIAEWIKVGKKCPFKCSEEDLIPIDLEQPQLQEYNSIKIQCFKNCSQIVPLGTLSDHLSVCGLENCHNHATCGTIAKYVIEGSKYCSDFCFVFSQMRANKERNRIQVFDLIRKYKLLKDKMRINFFSEETDFTEDGYVCEE